MSSPYFANGFANTSTVVNYTNSLNTLGNIATIYGPGSSGLTSYNPITYGPSSFSPTVYGPISYGARNLSDISYEEMLSFSFSKEIVKDYLYSIENSYSITYNLLSSNYFTLVENDLSDELINASSLLEFYTLGRGLAVVAYDMCYNRLELSAICRAETPVSNIDALLDDSLAIKKNKEDYFSSLKARLLPLVNYKFLDFTNKLLSFKKNLKLGLTPAIHVPNYIYNLSTNPKTTSAFSKASALLECMSSEVYLVNKSVLPDIQPYFSPEYSYLSFLNDKTYILKALQTFDKSKKGLIDLLTNITVAGTNVLPFVDLVIDYCALNQAINDIEGYTYIMIRNLIESNII